MEVLYPRSPASTSTRRPWSPPCACRRRQGRPRGPHLRHHHRGPARLAARLAENGCTRVAMEATGVYWRPVWHILAEHGFALVLANAAQVRNVPGRKTDVGDATWLAELLAHGLIRASFVPDGPTAELRSLLRTRKQLVRERAGHVLRLQKTLEDANVKLDGVVADLLGKSGRAMLEALVAGETDPARLAALAHPRLSATPERCGRRARAGDGAPPLPAAPHLDQVRRPGRGCRAVSTGRWRSTSPPFAPRPSCWPRSPASARSPPG